MTAKEDFEKNLPSIEEFKKGGVKMLVIIVNRADGEKAVRFLRERHFLFQFSVMAEGTMGSELLDLFGLGSTDKSMVICISSGLRLTALLPELEEALNLRKSGKGIAFTIPVSGVGIPEILQARISALEPIIKNMETEVDKMNNDITHSLILAVVNQGNSEELVEAAKKAGAKGGTIVSARRTGIDEAVKFFGLTVQPEKEVIAILTSRKDKQAIMDAINDSFGLSTPARGIILSVPVDGVAGS